MSDYKFDETPAAKKFLDGENPNETIEDALKATEQMIKEHHKDLFPKHTDSYAEQILKDIVDTTDWSDASCYASEKILKSIIVDGDYETAAKRVQSSLDYKANENSQRQRANRKGKTNNNNFLNEFIKANLQKVGNNLTPEKLRKLINYGESCVGKNPSYPENDERIITIEDETTIVVKPFDGQAEKIISGTNEALSSRIRLVKMD